MQEQPGARPRAVAGVIMLVIAAVIIISAYGSLPSAGTCQAIQGIDASAACRSVPSAATFIWAGAIAFLGTLTLAPWWLHWLAAR